MRVDKFIWCVRLYKTRSLAADVAAMWVALNFGVQVVFPERT